MKRNVEVLAWTPYEMLGIDLSFIKHELNFMPKTWHVKQRERKSLVKHVDAVIEEVDNLNEADVIRDPSWLSNMVVVKKKNGK